VREKVSGSRRVGRAAGQMLGVRANCGTELKMEMNAAALVVAVISFGWLVFQVEQARWAEGPARRAAYA